MLYSKENANRRLVFNAKQLYLFQEKEFQLRNQITDNNLFGGVDKLNDDEASGDGVCFILGYN